MHNLVKYNTLTVTGSNLRNIMTLVGKNSVNDLSISDAYLINYNCISDSEKWKINIVNEIIDFRYKTIDISNFTNSEINDILDYVCTS